jgi:hypothetical protein
MNTFEDTYCPVTQKIELISVWQKVSFYISSASTVSVYWNWNNTKEL